MAVISLPRLLAVTIAACAVADAGAADKKATDIPVNSIYKAKPALRTASPVHPRTFNKPSYAAVVTSKLKAMKTGSSVPRTTTKRKTTKAATKKGKTTKKVKTTKRRTTTKKVKTTKRRPAKKTTPKRKATAAKKKATAKKLVKKPVKKVQVKRDDDCSNSVLNNIPVSYTPANNTPTGFLLDTFMDAAASAAWFPPVGYTLSTLDLWNATVDSSYIQYLYLSSYDVPACAAACNGRDECLGFNIFYERTPTYIPDDSCLDPPAYAGVTCSLYSARIDQSSSTNIGQWKRNFLVTIAGSNAYIRNWVPSRQAGYTSLKPAAGALDTVALNSSFSLFYTPQYCAQGCSDLTSANRAAAVANNDTTYQPCNYYNIFNVTYNQVFQGMYCSLFTALPTSETSYATYLANDGGTSFNVTGSFSASLYPQDSGNVNQTYQSGPTGADASCVAMGQTTYDGFTLACGYDMPAADLGNARGADFFTCLDLCGDFTGCTAVSYDGQTCYFKNPDAQRVPAKRDGIDLAFIASKYTPPTNIAQAFVTTATVAWAGASTTVITSYSDLTAVVLTKTPGGAGSAPVPTVFLDGGSASTIAVVSASDGVSSYFPTPSCGGKGANFALYTLVPTATGSYDPEVYRTAAPSASGVSSYVGFHAQNNGTVQTIYGQEQVTITDLVVSQTFYLYAGHGTGYYYFSIPQADDIEILWAGTPSLRTWASSNAVQTSTGSGQQQMWAVFLTFGTYFPFRINWANADGAAALTLTIDAPDGSHILQTSQSGDNAGILTSNIVTSACDGSSAFEPWAAAA